MAQILPAESVNDMGKLIIVYFLKYSPGCHIIILICALTLLGNFYVLHDSWNFRGNNISVGGFKESNPKIVKDFYYLWLASCNLSDEQPNEN